MTYSYCKYNVISIMWECMGMYGIGSSIISVVWYEQSISKYLMHFVRWKAFETCWDDQQAVLFIFAITQGVHQRWIAASNGRAWNAAEPEFWLKIFNKWQPSFSYQIITTNKSTGGYHSVITLYHRVSLSYHMVMTLLPVGKCWKNQRFQNLPGVCSPAPATTPGKASKVGSSNWGHRWVCGIQDEMPKVHLGSAKQMAKIHQLSLR